MIHCDLSAFENTLRLEGSVCVNASCALILTASPRGAAGGCAVSRAVRVLAASSRFPCASSALALSIVAHAFGSSVSCCFNRAACCMHCRALGSEGLASRALLHLFQASSG